MMQNVGHSVPLICSIASSRVLVTFQAPSSSSYDPASLKFNYFLTMIYAPSAILAAAIALNIFSPSLAMPFREIPRNTFATDLVSSLVGTSVRDGTNAVIAEAE